MSNVSNGVYLVGTRKMRKNLKAAGADLKDLREPHKKAAEVVVRVAKPKTPKRSGKLAASVRGSGTQAAGIIRAGNNSSVPYANPIHWGWPAHNIKPQPWVSSAAQQSEPQWLPEFMKELEEAIALIAKDYT